VGDFFSQHRRGQRKASTQTIKRDSRIGESTVLDIGWNTAHLEMEVWGGKKDQDSQIVGEEKT